jgi:hypothetical protein
VDVEKLSEKGGTTMIRGKKVVGACALVLLCATVAQAGTNIGNASQTLWGTTYPTTTWFVGNDSTQFPGEFFEPEGMTYYDGTLYVSCDGSEADPALVSYTPGALGSLMTPTPLPVALIPDGMGGNDVVGPEGITVNYSAAGYGTYAGSIPILTAVEGGTDPAEVIEKAVLNIELGTASPAPVTNDHQPPPFFDPDDIAYAGSLDQFAVIQDVGQGNRIDFFDDTEPTLTFASSFPLATLTPTGGLAGDAKGLAVVSEAFGELLSGEDIATAEAVLVAHETNHISLWDLNGIQIGDTMEFTSGLLPPEALESEIESIAVDEQNQLIYVGDEKGFAVTVIRIPEPATGLLLLGGLTVALGRRR